MSIYFFTKRIFDICFSLGVIVIGFPVFLIIALIIKCTSPGPVFYAGKRMGKNHAVFSIYKFRTMYIDAEEKLSELLKQNPHLQKEWDEFQKLKNDPRITPIGQFLRRSSLDETPQFMNVLAGKLSVVGPRPHYVMDLPDGASDKILSVRPGITGLWQTSGRNNLSFQERIQLELQYVNECSFLYDLKLVFKTLPVFFFPKGAF